jgi:hypothetical protein
MAKNGRSKLYSGRRCAISRHPAGHFYEFVDMERWLWPSAFAGSGARHIAAGQTHFAGRSAQTESSGRRNFEFGITPA